jgi:hypothetical protein
VRSGREPDPVALAGEHLEAEAAGVEALEPRQVVRLQRQLGEAVGQAIHGSARHTRG